MPTVSAQFLFDIGSPNAYLCHKLIPAISARTGVPFSYVPILLGGLFKLTGNRSPAEAFAGIPNKRAYERVEFSRFLRRHGLQHVYRPNPHFPINTLPLMRCAVATQQLGCFPDYVDAIFSAAWEQDADLADPGVVLASLAAAGLDGSAIVARSQSADVKAMLIANTQDAFERGAFGAPTLFVGAEIFFGKDRLDDVEEEINKTSL